MLTRKERAEIFSKNLLDIMRSRGMDHSMLAAKTGKPLRTVYNWTAGANVPRIQSIAGIAKALNCKVTDLTDEKLPAGVVATGTAEIQQQQPAQASQLPDEILGKSSQFWQIMELIDKLDKPEQQQALQVLTAMFSNKL